MGTQETPLLPTGCRTAPGGASDRRPWTFRGQSQELIKNGRVGSGGGRGVGSTLLNDGASWGGEW